MSVGGGGGGGDVDFAGLVEPDLKGACGIQTFSLMRSGPPNLLIVLDRSGSMGAGAGSKWDQITTAINTVVPQLQGQIKWGLEFFPTDNDCGVSATIAVPVAANNATAIATAMAGTSADGNTPTAEAIRKGAAYLQSVNDPNPKFIVLATDGAPNCAAPTTPGSGMCTCQAPFTQMGNQCCFGTACIPCSFFPSPDAGSGQAVADAAAMGINTFVIGVATGSSEEAVLNDLATKGNTARPGATKYYPAANGTDFVNAINSIAGQIVSCTLALQMPPTSPDLVELSTGTGTTIPRDTTHANGWDFGPNNGSIILYGSWCQQLQTGAVTDVSAIYQCPPVN
jgi:hypothetical protein